MTSTDAPTTASLLRSAPGALAEYTLVRHVELDPRLLVRYGPDARSSWRRDLESRLANLASALEVGRPELFADFVRWQRKGVVARGVDPGDLRRSLECLREILLAELPRGAGEAAARAVDGALGGFDSPAGGPDRGHFGKGPHHELAARFLVELLEWHGEEAERLVLDAVASGVGLPEIYTHVFLSVAIEVGRLWHAGELSIAEEHYVTSAIQGLMARLTSAHTAPARDGRTVVVCAVGGDAHDMAVRMLDGFFRWSGWRVHSLGAGTPPADIVQAVADADANVVGLSATMVSHLAAVLATVDALRADERTRAVKILVGGYPFDIAPDLWRELGADGWASDAPQAVERAEQLVAAH